MRKVKIALPTEGSGGLEGIVSEVFGKAETFTIVEVEDGRIESVHVIANPGASYEYGSGPIAVKTLVDLKIDFVVAVEVGPTVFSLLEHRGVRVIPVEPGVRVIDAVRGNMSKFKASP